jgi:hypothetical protein
MAAVSRRLSLKPASTYLNPRDNYDAAIKFCADKSIFSRIEKARRLATAAAASKRARERQEFTMASIRLSLSLGG